MLEASLSRLAVVNIQSDDSASSANKTEKVIQEISNSIRKYWIFWFFGNTEPAFPKCS